MIGIELHVPEFPQVRAFYYNLGFILIREEPNYMVMALEDNLINFYGGTSAVHQHDYFKRFDISSPKGVGVEVIVMLDDLMAVYQRALKLGCVRSELQQRHWGAQDFRISDPFGYYLRFTSRYELARKP